MDVDSLEARFTDPMIRGGVEEGKEEEEELFFDSTGFRKVVRSLVVPFTAVRGVAFNEFIRLLDATAESLVIALTPDCDGNVAVGLI